MATPRKKRGKTLADGVAVIYCRYSSHNQRDCSIEQQIEACQKYAAEMDIKVISVYADRAISGKTEKRPQFQRMMKDAKKGLFQFVLAWKSNRLGRNMLQSMVTEETLRELGIRCLYVEEDFEDTAAGRFALRNMMNVNQFYSENMAEDIRRGMMDNAAQCKVNGSIPFGYKKTEDNRFAIDEPKAAIIREIYQRVANGEQYMSIARDLNARGIRTSTGREFGRSSMHSIIHNERYRGIYSFSDVRIEGGIPRIVEDDLFYRVQEVTKTKRNAEGIVRNRGDYLLTGKLFCGFCKSPMVGISGTSKTGAIHYYYTCQKKHKKGDCQKKNVRRDEIELAVAKALYSYLLDDHVIDWIADFTVEHFKKKAEAPELKIMQDELTGVNASLNNIMKAIEQGIINETTQSRMLALEEERKSLAGRIATAKADIITVPRESIVAGMKKMRDGNVTSKAYQRELFDLFLRAVYLYDDELKIVFSFDGGKGHEKGYSIKFDAAVDAVDALSTGGGKVRTESSQVHQSVSVRTPHIGIYAIDGLFVLVTTLSFLRE